MLLEMKQDFPLYYKRLDQLDDRRAYTIRDFYAGSLFFRISGCHPNYFFLDGEASDLFDEKKILLRAFYDDNNPIYHNGVIRKEDEWKYKNQIFSTEEELENRLLEIQDKLIKLGVFSNAQENYLLGGAYINLAPNRLKTFKWKNKESEEQFLNDLEESGGTLMNWFEKFDDNNYDLTSWRD